MILIDALQRLGVAYLFENDINEALRSIYVEHVNCNINNGVTDDLYTVALSFRLLRQQGYHISSAKLAWAYFREANWYYKGYMPTFEEYLSVSVMSSGYRMLAIQILIGMVDIGTKEAFDWVITVPKIVKLCALIAQLVDDIQTHKVEQERGDAPLSVQCYMREHGVSEKEACEKIKEMMESAWKDINEKLQKPNRPPLPLLLPALNLARMMKVIYHQGDGYSNSSGRTKDIIASLPVDPISM
ncbi:hypothetical protein F0562_010190 [Nyssa sinensis]|uniref:Terpene synthase metal-binding domain-containing protein n=1 Tax=Nyssa sinensis TaxID=561372 RepID=A0A5J5A367_9ASTE|nr:hypothetical protein F0562_010190 [Nyssa sinensis]